MPVHTSVQWHYNGQHLLAYITPREPDKRPSLSVEKAAAAGCPPAACACFMHGAETASQNEAQIFGSPATAKP